VGEGIAVRETICTPSSEVHRYLMIRNTGNAWDLTGHRLDFPLYTQK
jgi:hypothetical protein